MRKASADFMRTHLKPMTTETTIAAYFIVGIYAFLSTIFIFLQEILRKSQIDIPDKFLLFSAVGLAVFGGVSSYIWQLQQTKNQYNHRDLLFNTVVSAFVALLLGLFLAGYISTEWWLGVILGSAFFKNVILAIIPRAIEKKTSEFLHLSSDKENDNAVN